MGTDGRNGGAHAWVRLVRPHHWAKGIFVLVGPAYALRGGARSASDVALGAACAFLAFGFASSACYVLNDIADAEEDRRHPRKRTRPVASGAISPRSAGVGAVLLLGLSAACCAYLGGSAGALLGGFVGVYALNVGAYSLVLKRHAVADVVSLALGFVLRVVGGCFAAGVMPSTWLLTCSFFLAMFLAFGKRLGERRTMGSAEGAASTRAVQSVYTDEILRMLVAVTGVACLVTYAGYVQGRTGAGSAILPAGALWTTLLPSTYALLRAIVLIETGRYDDPTDLALRDRPFQAAAAAFAALSALAIWAAKSGD